MTLTNRDREILRVLSHNAYSASQIAALYFTSNKKAAERLKSLFDSGFVNRFAQPFMEGRGKAEFIYCLSRRGFELAKGLPGRFAPATVNPLRNVYSLPHRLMTGDFHVAVSKPAPKGFQAQFFYPAQLGMGAGGIGGLVPDGVLVIEQASTGKKLLHFVEADCGSETLRSQKNYSLEHKLEKYVSLFEDPKACEPVCTALGYAFSGFRVLFVAKDGKRVGAVMPVAERLSAEFVWFAEHAQVRAFRVFEAVWSNHVHASLSLTAPYPPRRDPDGVNRAGK